MIEWSSYYNALGKIPLLLLKWVTTSVFLNVPKCRDSQGTYEDSDIEFNPPTK